MSTVTQSRLLALAKYHAASAGRWPSRADERAHYAATPARAVSMFALRPGYGYCVSWINGAHDGVNYYRDEADALAYIARAIRDMQEEEG